MVYQQLYCWWPYNGLWLYKDFLLYQRQAVDSSVSNSGARAFSCHLCYLTAEMVPFTLLSCKLNEVEKSALADSLLALKPKQSHFFNAKIILGMVGQASQKIIDSSTLLWQTCLSLLPQTTIIPFWLKLFWTGQTHQYIYHNALVKIDAINVINDCAERGIKTLIRFLCYIKISYKWQNRTKKSSKLASSKK